MNYLGGKKRQGPTIARLLNEEVRLIGATNYVEPFCGALGVAQHVECDNLFLSDSCKALIRMWTHLIKGPPPIFRM